MRSAVSSVPIEVCILYVMYDHVLYMMYWLVTFVRHLLEQHDNVLYMILVRYDNVLYMILVLYDD